MSIGMMSKSRDEKIKLTAGLLNTAAGSSLTVGLIAPSVAVFLNLGDAAVKVPPSALLINILFWASSAVILHVVARTLLNGLDR